ncbi:HdeD family acid-resistance protein [Bordetella tumulicola]|uniref:HdeD family acid-resistance protein n=1 Tax=Bordetella tumulicola TaxID=1649133 RepID=UPI0039F0064C
MADPNPDFQRPSEPLTKTLNALRAHWGWFVAIGIALVVLGVVALVHVFAATLVSVIFIGTLMLIGAVGQLIQAWRVKHWSGFVIWSLSGLLYGAAGVVAVTNPVAGAAMLTLLLGATLIAAGAFRLWVWFNHRSQQGWRWLALSGVLTFAIGILIAAGWPANSLTILGLLLGFDLLFQGWSLLFAGLALRKAE